MTVNQFEIEQAPQKLDPIKVWNGIITQIGQVDAKNWDHWIRERNKLIDQALERLPYSERFGSILRIIEVGKAMWALDHIQKINAQTYKGFEINEILDLRTVSETLAVLTSSREQMSTKQNQENVTKSYVPTSPVDAFTISTGIQALAMKEGLSMGRRAVDLGGGDGGMAIPLALAGFEAVSIERDRILHEQALENVRKLATHGVILRPNQIHFIHGKFHSKKEKNTPQIEYILSNADVFYCYPWPGEVGDRLELFSNHAKPKAILVTYASGLDNWYVTPKLLAKFSLKPVGPANLPTPLFGSQWCVLRRKGE